MVQFEAELDVFHAFAGLKMISELVAGIGVADGAGIVVTEGYARVVVPRAFMQRTVSSLRRTRQVLPIADGLAI